MHKLDTTSFELEPDAGTLAICRAVRGKGVEAWR